MSDGFLASRFGDRDHMLSARQATLEIAFMLGDPFRGCHSG